MMKKKVSFEAAMNKLETIVDRLESGNESLESSLKLFEEGSKIASFCYGVLQDAEQRVIDISKLERGKTAKSGCQTDEQ